MRVCEWCLEGRPFRQEDGENMRIFVLDSGAHLCWKSWPHSSPCLTGKAKAQLPCSVSCRFAADYSNKMAPSFRSNVYLGNIIRLKRTWAESWQCGKPCIPTRRKKEANKTEGRLEVSWRKAVQVMEQMWQKLKVTRWGFFEELKETGTSFEYVHI